MKLLRILQRNGAHATFFDVGNRLAYWPRAAYAEARLGGVGNHTWSHAHLTRLPHWLVWLQLMTTQYQVESQIGWKPRLFRTPYAEHSRATDDISLRLGPRRGVLERRRARRHPARSRRLNRPERRTRVATRVDHPPTRPASLDRPRTAEDPAGDPAPGPARSVRPGAARHRSSCGGSAMPLRFVLVKRTVVMIAVVVARRRVGGAGGAAPWSEDADAQHLLLLRSDQADVAREPLVQHQDVVVLARAAERLPGAGGPRLARLRAALTPARRSPSAQVESSTTSGATRRRSSFSPTATPGVRTASRARRASTASCARTGTGTASSCRASRSGSGSRLDLEREQVVDRLAAADQPCVAVRYEHRRGPRHRVVRRGTSRACTRR